MKRLLAALALLTSLPALATQDIVGPAGSSVYGAFLKVLPTGNILVGDPSYSIPGGAANVGAVYLLNGTTFAVISKITGSTANDYVGYGGITVLANGNFVINSPYWSNGGATMAGAVTWGSATTGVAGIVDASNSLVGGSTKDYVGGGGVTVLPNGHYVISSSSWRNSSGTAGVGAVTWCNGNGGTVGLISDSNSLVGGTASDGVGMVVLLTNGNYVVVAPAWDNPAGPVANVGAVIWCSGASGKVGVVSAADALIGGTTGDGVGAATSNSVSMVTPLTNGNYVVGSGSWHNPATPAYAVGAATWCNGATGSVGTVTTANSLYGTTAGDGVGAAIPLTNGNYVITAPDWDNPSGPAVNAGAVAWGNGLGGTVGAIAASNSLVGGTASDRIGGNSGLKVVKALTNGNYVVGSPGWNNPSGAADVGAATWCNGTGGTTGLISAANSLIGSTASDQVGETVTPCTNGNYVVGSSLWDNPSGPVANVGAATWCDGATGRTGTISATNSLIGGTAADQVGGAVTALTNGSYVVASYQWDNPSGPKTNVGAATWCKADGTTVGLVTAANSLIGAAANDGIGYYPGVIALTNGNYVVNSSNWIDSGAGGRVGASTWGNGATGTTGVVGAGNSIVGAYFLDGFGSGGTTALSNGGYVVNSPGYNSNAGVVSYGSGSAPATGQPTATNSVFGGSSIWAYDEMRERLFVRQTSGNTITVFAPLASGPEISVTGNGMLISDGNAVPDAFRQTDFGGTAAAGGTVVRTFTILNPGTQVLNLTGAPKVAVSGANAADFTVTTQPAATVAINGSTTFQVTFNPSSVGLRTATLSITNDDTNEGVYDFAIQGTGTGIAPDIAVTGNSTLIVDGDSTPRAADHTDFGNAGTLGETVVRTFTISNSGSAVLNLSGTPKVEVGGTHAADFTVTTQPAATVPINGSTTFQVTFDPSAVGLRTATLSITNNDSDESPYNFTIQGTGMPSIAEIAVEQPAGTDLNSGSTISFGIQQVGITSAVKTFTIKNTGNINLTLGAITKEGAYPDDFLVTAPAKLIVAPGASTTFTAAYKPTDGGARSTTIHIPCNDDDENPFDLILKGSDGAPTISVIANQETDEDVQAGPIAISIGDEDGPASELTLSGSSENTALIPDENIEFGGSGSARTLTLTPAPDKYGTAVITIVVTDASGHSAGTSFVLTVHSVSEAPVAPTQADSGMENDLLHMPLLAYDPDGDPLTYQLKSNPAHGSVVISQDGTYSYLPDANYLGADKFTYAADDGTASSNVGTVTILIVRQPPRWTWMEGSNLTNLRGTYGMIPGTLGTPGARSGAGTWSDGSGTLWIFGGTGYGNGTTAGDLSDLWRCDLGTKTWGWLGGSNVVKSKGAYGTQGTAAGSNFPGGRSGAATWRDASGNLWLFGGAGLDSSATGNGLLNDLWKYNIGSNQWAWMSGSKLIKANGTYATQGTADATSVPGARSGAVSWVDVNGNLWLFGGNGLPADGTTAGVLNDLWKYDTVTNRWTWIKGASTLKAPGVYGAQGVGTTDTTPGARSDACAWVDANGMFWLFGGSGAGATTATGNLNDLWKYDPSANLWTWMRGDTKPGSAGNSGTLSVADAANDPAARAGAAPWVDKEGALCLFGGMGSGGRDDVWRYQPATNQWAWIKGSNAVSAKPVYGIKGTGDPSNTPGARKDSAAAVDLLGDPWIFGGANGTAYFNDLWQLDVPPAMGVETRAASLVTGNSATLEGVINPRGIDTTARFRYSPRMDMTGAAETSLTMIGDGTANVQILAPVSGLAAGTTYYFQLVATNAFGRYSGDLRKLTTTGSAPVVKAAFSASSSKVNESVGRAIVKVELSAPATVSFDLPFALTGTAVAGATGDYTAPPSPLSFIAGQMVGQISIPIRDDLVPEGSKTIILTLSTPAFGGVTLGTTVAHTLTITDGDLPVVIGQQPQTQFVAMGDTATFTVTAAGSKPLTYQWKKNGTKIAGATSASYSLPDTPLNAAATYSVDVTNALGTKSSAGAELYVVDTTPKYYSQAVNTSVSFTVNTGGAGVEFQWKKGPLDLANEKTKTLTLNKLATTDAAVYTCRVSKPGKGGLTSGDFTLTVPTIKPVITPITTLTTGIVGGAYVHQILFDTSPLKAPKSFTVTGLPAGLKLDATTGIISGDCTAAVNAKPITITATNSAGTSDKVNCTLTILILPPEVQGTWLARVDRRPDVGGNLGARLDLTVTPSGNFTGKLLLEGASLSITENLIVLIDTSGLSPVVTSISGRALLARKGLPPLDLNFNLGLTNVLTGFLLDPLTGGSAQINGFRNKWVKSGPKASDYSGQYNFGLDLTATDIGDIDRPQGHGFGSFTVADDGKLTVAGSMADGLDFTAAGFVGPGGQVVIYAPFKPSIGSVLGIGSITAVSAGGFANNTFTGTLTWNKGPAPKTSAEQAYRLGFPPMNLTISGGKYRAPASGGVVMGLTNLDNKARVSFLDGGLNPGDINPLVFSIRNTKATGIAQTVKVATYDAKKSPNPNPNKVTFALAATPAGQFSGSFTLPNSNTALTRTANYEGIMVWDGSAYSAMGYFLLPKLPEPGQTLKTSPVLSGEAVLDGAP